MQHSCIGFTPACYKEVPVERCHCGMTCGNVSADTPWCSNPEVLGFFVQEKNSG